ncbi:hypothetical protein [Bifidobacterium longum]|uniref:hypothetical protein n=1 Tax=Bifidobacterium longum TaxID=216816 RepID=UPI001F1DD0A6|nr:hypothetical protein [Bifidobacterium longum]UVY27987.1 MAG: hypothetical protein [Bacteriophage sp.]DAZ52405.1 MAG TPA: hypothetical protein [Caudoviricetes sp.]
MVRHRPSLAEALSVWASPYDAAELLEQFRNAVVSLAEQQRTGLPDSARVLDILQLRKGTELAALGGDWPAMGVRLVGGAWTLDARQFDLWAQGQISIFRRRAATGRTPASSASVQSKLNLF